ncbi:protein PTHB1 [Drosophila subobscura]|uniref:protein PTHB1 n=1 Tax=Drosophila subobscura TaxID=7241 RepID=UPI00155A05CB|nr:protein PTHB1 [Drosophila subobscura]
MVAMATSNPATTLAMTMTPALSRESKSTAIMSLFNVCSWWSAQCADAGEQYDVASLLCARFGLEAQEKDYIIVGSQTGQLSIYYPHRRGYDATDLLLETQMASPILGLYAGKFSGNVRNENTNQLGVLLPNAIAIYNVQAIGGLAEHGAQLRLQLQAEHKFPRVAFGLCQGHFGQVKGREFFCVVHLDGTLTFYEQDGISYECRFPGHRALPAPVAYCERTDSFFRFSATWHLQCFSYQDLSHSLVTKSSYQPTWTQGVGEGIVDMRVVQVKDNCSYIMILGERNFIALDDNGKFIFMLKLDYAPKCFHSFVVGYYWEPGARLITAIVSDSSKLHVYEEANIIWAAQWPNQSPAPVAIQRSNMQGLAGGIVTLGAKGQLEVGYLGAEPFTFQVQPLNIEELSFAQAHKELQQLEDEIKEAVDVRDMDALNQQAADQVRLSFSIQAEVSDDLDTLLLDVPADVAVKELPSAKGLLRFKVKADLAELQLVFHTPSGVRCSQDTMSFVDVSAGTSQELKLDFYIAELLHIHSTKVEVVASFVTPRGIPRVIQQSAHLPLAMFYRVCQPQKAAGIKLTYSITSRHVVPKLGTFFGEFLEGQADAAPHALGLQLLCPGLDKQSELITVVAAKNSNRIRIQSDCVETFAMILERIVGTTLQLDSSAGLIKMHKKKPKRGVLNRCVERLMAAPFLPVQPILHRVDVHHETQQNIRKQTEQLEDLWLQFKALQRQLQEQQEQEPKEAITMQIETNYDQLILEGDKLVEIRRDERRQRCDLNCAVALAKWIIQALNLEERVVNVVGSVLSIPIEDWTELSWEESMAPGIDMLHHFGPLTRSKSTSTHGLLDATDSSKESFDYGRFRRHFATLFDRIVRLASSPQPAASGAVAEQPVAVGEQQGQAKQVDEIGNMQRMLGDQGMPLAAAKRKSNMSSSLEAVEDDEEYDEEDLREDVGYRKEYGTGTTTGTGTGTGAQKKTSAQPRSEWVNEDFELPTTEELFSDLGIWW